MTPEQTADADAVRESWYVVREVEGPPYEEVVSGPHVDEGTAWDNCPDDAWHTITPHPMTGGQG